MSLETPSADVNATVYQGLQRLYRNAIVGHLRERLQREFPNDFVDRLRSPFRPEEWNEIKAAAASSRSIGALEAAVTDDFDLLGVNHFFNVFDKFWSILRPQSVASPEADGKTRQSVLGWMREIKNLRDPLSHPSEREFSKEDAFHGLDCARRTLKSLGLHKPADEIKALQQAIFAPSSDRGLREPLEAKLPSRDAIVVDFVGRSSELEHLMEWLTDPISRRWALAGDGGKGKSALAYSFAVRVIAEAPPPLQTVVWLTAKRRQFVEGKTVERDHPDFADLSEALNCILSHYGWTEELSAPLESRRSRSLELLKQFPALLVVDDIDSIEAENEDVIEFFTLQVPNVGGSKVLLTSRRTVFGMGASTTHVSGFTASDGEAFVRSRCQIMGLDLDLFGKQTVKELLRVADGSPLYLEDLLRLTASVGSVNDAMKAWQSRAGSEARKYALGRECDLLSPNARKVLLAAGVVDGPVVFGELESITGLSAETVTGAIQELQRLFLVPKPRQIKGEQRFELNANTKTLVREVYGSDAAYRQLRAAYVAISQGVPLTGRGRVAGLIRQASFSVRSNRAEEAESLIVAALESYPNDPDLTGALAWIYKAWVPVRLTDARERFRRAYQLRNVNQSTYEHWSNMEWKEGEWVRSAEAAEAGLNLLPSSKSLLFLAGRARRRASRELAGGLHHEKAQAEAQLARSLLERADGVKDGDDAVRDREIYRTLVLVCELQADVHGMQKYFARWRASAAEDPDLASEWSRLSNKFKLGASPETV